MAPSIETPQAQLLSAAHLPMVLVLASGRGERFRASGGAVHKLQALLGGKPVLQHTLDTVRASGLPFFLVDQGYAGMGDSIAAGVRASADAAGWLVLPGDLPLVQASTLQAVAQALQIHDVVIPTCAGQRGHPVGFSAACKSALMSLKGPEGAMSIARARRITELPVDDTGAVTDIDTLQDLQRAEVLLTLRKP